MRRRRAPRARRRRATRRRRGPRTVAAPGGARPPLSGGDVLDQSGLTECTVPVRRQDSSSDFQTPDRRSGDAAAGPGMRGLCRCEMRLFAVDLSPALLERHNRQQPLQGLSSLSLGDREALNLDNFAIVCKIGEGSFGKVVLARKKDDGALHAVKAVRKEKLLASGSAAIQHVLDENSILQRLRHPFVLTLQYAFQDADRLYLVTNYVGGGTLYQLITQRGKGQGGAREILRGAARRSFCLFASEQRGVPRFEAGERPARLDGYVVLADFGLAKTLVDTTTANLLWYSIILSAKSLLGGPTRFPSTGGLLGASRWKC